MVFFYAIFNSTNTILRYYKQNLINQYNVGGGQEL